MQRSKPPFRADHVGSLLRPAALKEARERRAKGEISAAERAVVEDREIERVIKKQEEIGLRGITDGEFRRSWWHLDFLWGLDGVERYVMDQGIAFSGERTRAEGARVVGKLGFSDHPMIAHFKFLAAHARQTPKVTIPAPSALYGRVGREAVSASVYPELDDFFADLGAAYRKVTTKTGRLESKETLKRRIDEAAKYVDPEQLCLSPQCGFASTEEGNVLAEEEQWAKLRTIVEVANEVWG
jgi:5-methyltetrahydropteroyltriglutamate--homocysteine methyltransferase